MKNLIYILFLLGSLVNAQLNPNPALISVSLGQEVGSNELLITTTSTSASWSPELVTNTGVTLVWEVTGGVTIAEQSTNDPTFNLVGNTGTATIHIKSETNFSGFTEFRLKHLNIATIDVLNAIDLTWIEQLNGTISTIDLTSNTNLTDIWLQQNNLSTINISQNTLLEFLPIDDNSLTSLDVSNNTLLTDLWANNNLLTTSELDNIIIDLDNNGQSNGVLRISNNTGLPLTSTSYDEYLSLISKGWTIDVANSTPTDTQDPVIGTLSYANVTDTTVDLSCTATDNVAVTGFKIYEDAVYQYTVNQSVLSNYEYTGLTQSTNYDFYVVAEDAATNTSDNSNTVNFTTIATPPPNGFTPVLSNFYTDNTNKDRVYFDSSESITGSTGANGITGFTVSGKSINQLTVNGTSTTGHYFTVTSAFDFWDNNTIRYEGGSDIADTDSNSLYDFTLEYVTNNIAEPSATTNTYFVATDGSNGAAGTSEGTAWATIDYAASQATAGSTVWIKAGNYGADFVTVDNNGTPTSPIKFIGYKTTTGDINSMYWTYSKGRGLDHAEMPSIVCNNITSDRAIKMYARENIIIRNMQFEGGYYTIWIRDDLATNAIGCKNIIVDNCLIVDGGDAGFDSEDILNERIRFINSTCYNTSVTNFNLIGQHSLLSGCLSWGDNNYADTSDYAFSIGGSNNIGINLEGGLKEDAASVGHGMSVKANGEITEYVLIEDVLIWNCYLPLEMKHSQTKYGVMRNCTSDVDIAVTVGGINVSNGASYNRFEGIKLNSPQRATFYGEGVEDDSNTTRGNNNTFVNCYFDEVGSVLYDAGGGAMEVYENEYINCTFRGASSNSRVVWDTSGTRDNHFINCIFTDILVERLNGSTIAVDYDYCDFYNNGFTPINNTNGLTVNPTYSPFPTPTNTALNAGLIVTDVDYDLNEVERSKLTTAGNKLTIGAVEIDK